MAEISKITLPTGTTYDIKDAHARELIDEMSGYTDFLGVTTTALTDGATTNPITVSNKSVTAKKGNIATYGSSEFIFNGTAWQAFGDLSALGALAYKDSASGSGTVAVPKTYTTTVTPQAKNVSVSGTTTGSVSETKGKVTVGKASSGTTTYTPEGSVSTPTITVTPSTTSKYVASSATGGGSVSAGTAAACTLPQLSTSVTNETLTIGWDAGSFTANTPTAVTLPSFSQQTIATGISSASSSQPTFTGTGARLETEAQVLTGASFVGASMSSSGSYTPAAPTATTTTATTESKTVNVTVS